MEIEVSRDGGVQTITLNRPEVLNALTTELLRQLAATLEEARSAEVRAVVITGAGRGFCVGQDLAAFREGAGDVRTFLREHYHPVVLAIRELEKPVIAGVNGAAAGAGLSLACACDLRVASGEAVFVPGFIGIGLVPDAGGSHFVERILGQARAFEWMSSGRRLPAEEALAWGLVSEVVEADRFPERVAEIASSYARAPTRAIGLTKRLLAQAGATTLEQQLELERELQAVAAATADFREGVAAFTLKREPRFTGS